MNSFETWQIAIGIAGVLSVLFAGIMAVWIGVKQNEINSRLLQLQDYVAITVAPSNEGTVGLWNTGNSNLYIWGFDMPSNLQRFEKPRLISPSTVANYWIPAPNFGEISTTTNFEFKLYLTDEYDNRWVSENGGIAEPVKYLKDGKEVTDIRITVWSYKTFKNEWRFDIPSISNPTKSTS